MSAVRRHDLSQHCDVNDRVNILAPCTIMTCLACIILVARIYSRGWMSHSTDRDDYTMWVAVALSVVGFSIIVPEVYSGAGRYGSCLLPEDLQRSLMLQFITQLIYTCSILLVKVSIVFCLLRFAPSKAFNRFLWAIMIFFIITASMYFIVEVTQCQPLKMIWDVSAKGRCLSPLVMQAAGYVNNAISLTVDLLLATLPIPMIWNLQVEMHVKVAIAFVMSLGALAAAACAIRLYYLAPSTATGDALFDTIPWTIWTTVECNIAIIAASVPSILPILKKFNELRKGINPNSRERSRAMMQNAEQRNPKYENNDAVRLWKGPVQRDASEGGHKDIMIKVGGEEFSPLEIDDFEDISQMYANASRIVAKHTTMPQVIQ